jgi:hypothetical protein
MTTLVQREGILCGLRLVRPTLRQQSKKKNMVNHLSKPAKEVDQAGPRIRCSPETVLRSIGISPNVAMWH